MSAGATARPSGPQGGARRGQRIGRGAGLRTRRRRRGGRRDRVRFGARHRRRHRIGTGGGGRAGCGARGGSGRPGTRARSGRNGVRTRGGGLSCVRSHRHLLLTVAAGRTGAGRSLRTGLPLSLPVRRRPCARPRTDRIRAHCATDRGTWRHRRHPGAPDAPRTRFGGGRAPAAICGGCGRRPAVTSPRCAGSCRRSRGWGRRVPTSFCGRCRASGRSSPRTSTPRLSRAAERLGLPGDPRQLARRAGADRTAAFASGLVRAALDRSVAEDVREAAGA